jgi:ADP-heptose:LPS heptosyltransferase
VGGPIEAGESWPAPRVDPPDPAALAAFAADMALWLGPDSGPSHLAAAVGTPTGVVFTGASDPRSWAPLGARVFDSPDPAEVADWVASSD